MGSLYRALDFAFIGHVETWRKAVDMVSILRDEQNGGMKEEDLVGVYHYIPPRKMFWLEFTSTFNNITKNGMYVETFIPPGSGLVTNHAANQDKINKAIEISNKHQVKIATLGGFTSILRGGDTTTEFNDLALTTGNTLTVALIVKGIEQLCRSLNRDESSQKLLIIGATGDIGIGCARYFNHKMNHICLAARNERRLKELKQSLEKKHCRIDISTNINVDIEWADIVISVASVETPAWITKKCKKNAIICDAGYPKNLVSSNSNTHWIYSGGMGIIEKGNVFDPAEMRIMYTYPDERIVHGCLLEAVVLAFEENHIPYSSGRGNITAERVEEMWSWAQKHGIGVAPYFNENGIIPDYEKSN